LPSWSPVTVDEVLSLIPIESDATHITTGETKLGYCTMVSVWNAAADIMAVVLESSGEGRFSNVDHNIAIWA
jgi:hypothetical protein